MEVNRETLYSLSVRMSLSAVDAQALADAEGTSLPTSSKTETVYCLIIFPLFSDSLTRYVATRQAVVP